VSVPILLITKKHKLEVNGLANIKSAKKRVLVTRTKTERNKAIKSAVKTSVKKVEAAVKANDKEAAKAELSATVSMIDKAASKGVYHKNTAARKVARLSKAVDSIA
jgi:small subunit ribosomal protein S20